MLTDHRNDKESNNPYGRRRSIPTTRNAKTDEEIEDRREKGRLMRQEKSISTADHP